MARETFDRAFRPTTPDDLLDPPVFGQPTEVLKDVLVLELRKYISSAQQTVERRIELPTIEKYATFGDGNDPFSTFATIVRKHPDTLESLPHIAVMATTGSERKLTIGPPLISTVQEPPQLTAGLPEPYALEDGDILAFTVTDRRGGNERDIRIVFSENRFPAGDPITSALAQDVANEINEQSTDLFATTSVDGADTFLVIKAGDRLSEENPYAIEVENTTTDNAAAAFELARSGDVTDIGGTAPDVTITAPAGAWTADDIGRYVVIGDSTRSFFNDGRFLITDFDTDTITDTLTYTNKYGRAETGSPATWFVGLRDDMLSADRPPKHRYGMAFDLSAQIDVICEDENTRGEVVDLVLSFFAFFLENKYFTFYGRSTFSGETVTGEHYQVVLNPPMRAAAENEYPRPGDSSGKVYVNSFNVDATVSMYLDREVYFPGTTTPFIVNSINLVADPSMPLMGDETFVTGDGS